MREVQGIVLTGGQSRRMGKDKSTLDFGGKKFTEHIIDVLKNVTNDIIIVGPKAEYKNFSGHFFEDIFKDKGPASGILTGLTESKHELNLILSCDVPLIKSSLLTGLMQAYNGEDALICGMDDQLHPLVGIYRKTCAKTIHKCIEKNNLKLTSIFDELNVGSYNVPRIWQEQLMNINLPMQYEKLKNDYSN